MSNHPNEHSEHAWQQLLEHSRQLSGQHVNALFESEPARATTFSTEACGLYLDYSKQRINEQTFTLLMNLAQSCNVERWRTMMFAGEVVNNTENRAALHVALRWPAAGPKAPFGQQILADVEQVRAQVERFSDAVRDQSWTGFTGQPVHDVVNIGIGGSDLGPAMVCNALRELAHPRIRCHFVSNADSAQLSAVLGRCDPATTLFIIASKTFSTQETMLNARSARTWLLQAAGGDETAIARHFVAVSSALERCAEFGIEAQNVFGFWDWVGGRYSLWSSIGLVIALSVGMPQFRELLAGAHAMDQHFQSTPFAQNLPVLLALVGIWNRNFLAAPSLAILPYDHCLELLPAFLQQLEMESNGKRVSRAGRPLAHNAAPIVWGTLGNNAQHAFYQMLHQGREEVPADFIVPVFSQSALPGHENTVISNALAQSEAMMRGRTLQQAREQLGEQELGAQELDAAAQHLVMPGNRPSSTILYERLTPYTLGALVALYEHKVFVQALCWDVNPFDQFGVELGKSLALSLLPALEGDVEVSDHDPSTRALLARVRAIRRNA
ncbi:MAG: glucose-6-phosphate isomerase [Gammaproteobacteria bacterium]